jgi:hypothetical protein
VSDVKDRGASASEAAGDEGHPDLKQALQQEGGRSKLSWRLEEFPATASESLSAS